MILLFSEGGFDYARYRYPYVIWGVPERDETPGQIMGCGFLPASPRLDRFYLCRNVRVALGRYEATTENRRIMRKGVGIEVELVARGDFEYSEARRQEWKGYADRRFGEGVMTFERLDRLMGGRVVTHVLRFRDAAAGREVGNVLMYLEEPRVAYYYYAFYDLAYLGRNLGMLMMTRAVELFAARGVEYLHLGTCYSEGALYKTQFNGVEFFNGAGWCHDVKELKYLVSRGQGTEEGHLFEGTDYLEKFYGGDLGRLAATGGIRVGLGGGGGSTSFA